MEAPSLSCDDKLKEGYRVLWIHVYRPAIVVSAMRVDNRWEIDAAQFKHPNTELIWAIEGRKRRPVSAVEVQPLLESLEAAEFWTTPAWIDSGGLDGGVWIVEGRRDRAYRVVSRGNPKDSAFVSAAQTLVRLASMTIPQETELSK